ncbi:MAG: efflux RND transporter periplasmic adaptor subunit [Sedimentisphaerales bacterium]|nr:efflux RND transporter periplasmic adaptor subunit [Sedimentisphaerales bacterium]
MAVDRPTFHEAWYRVADLRPRLLSDVNIRRQYFRGQLWYVLENPANSEYARIAENAYRFAGALDGRRTVAQVWQLCNEQLGDGAPTQGEVIQLLGQLYAMNLLHVDMPPDAQGLLNRYRRRVRRQVLNYLANLLFLRVPLIDPDAFLNRWVGVFGSLFSWPGFCLWVVLLAAGLYFVIANSGELFAQSADVLDPGNLILLYLSFVLVKVCHEFSHAFACKRFGRLNRSSGDVHSMGVMFLVLLPLPYVDASSAWAFRSKWHRAIVGMAGVMAELAAASVAAIVWAQTSTGTLHIIAYNVIFVASVSTVLFNGNPLLRFDAYYVLCDLIEIPNLAQRSRNYIYYLVKRYVWSVKKLQNPACGPGETVWFVLYGTTSTVYRVYISIRILLFLNRRLPEQLFILVPLFAIAAVGGWLIAPLVQFIRYLATGPELARNRRRAVASTAGGLCATFMLIGLVRMPDHYRIEGIVEPAQLALIHAESDGFVTDFLPSQSAASPDGPPLVQAINRELEAQKAILLAERRGLEARYRLAEIQETAAAQTIAEQIDALDESLARVQWQLDKLNLRSPFKGIWIAPEIEYSKGTYLRRGDTIGFVGSLNDLILRVTAGQDVAAMIFEQASQEVEIRIKGRPDRTLTGRIEKIFPAGSDELPSEALGYAAGGDMPTRSRAPQDTTAAEKFFEIRIKPAAPDASSLLTGQRVVARLTMTRKPLLIQWYQSARRLFQRRFHI